MCLHSAAAFQPSVATQHPTAGLTASRRPPSCHAYQGTPRSRSQAQNATATRCHAMPLPGPELQLGAAVEEWRKHLAQLCRVNELHRLLAAASNCKISQDAVGLQNRRREGRGCDLPVAPRSDTQQAPRRLILSAVCDSGQQKKRSSQSNRPRQGHIHTGAAGARVP
jgi:hypothetical protein